MEKASLLSTFATVSRQNESVSLTSADGADHVDTETPLVTSFCTFFLGFLKITLSLKNSLVF